LLLHLVDVSDASGRPDPTQDFKIIMGELESWGAGLESKPMLVVASKIDVANAEKLSKLKRFCSRKKLPFMAVSAVTGEGIEKLKYDVGVRVRKLRATPSDASANESQALPA
jgi:GTP-binding protein